MIAPSARGARRLLTRFAPQLLLALLVFAFRIPPLLNTSDVNSDVAVVGLEAMHFLRGEWSGFLWGYEYQSSFEPMLAAAAFALFGPRPILLLLLTIAGHLVLVFLVLDILRRRLPTWTAFLLAQTLVWMPHGANYISIHPVRQWAITQFVLGLWLVDDRFKGPLRHALGGFLIVSSIYMDVFCKELVPTGVLFAICASFDERRWSRGVMRMASFTAGAAAGALLVHKINALEIKPRGGVEAVSMLNVSKNWPLFWDECLPSSLLGTKVTFPADGLVQSRMIPTGVWLWAANLGAVAIGASLLFAAIAYGAPSIPWRARRLGVAGLAMAASAAAGFLLSGFVYNIYAIRYLAPIVWALPFVLTPLAAIVRPRYFAVPLVAYLVSAGVSGWLNYGREVRGSRIMRLPDGIGDDEHFLAESLRLRGVQFVMSPYWLSYRLSFLFEERPPVAPLDFVGERDAFSRPGFNAATKVAYIFHPLYEGGSPDSRAQALCGHPGACERYSIAAYSVLVVDRAKGTAKPRSAR